MKPRFRFVHASDLHLGRQHDPKFAQANARVRCFFDDLKFERAIAKPDWLVVTGDLTTLGTVDPGEFAAVKDELDGLGLPYDILPGNHDLCPSPEQSAKAPHVEAYEPVPLEATAYGRAFGERGLRWRARHADLEFFGLTLRAGDPDGELARLERDLAEPSEPSAARARIICGHYPAAPVREGGPLAKWGPGHLGPTAAELDALLTKQAQANPPVLAYLFGHVHALVAQSRGGLLHVTPGAVSVGCPGYRLFEVFEHELRTTWVPLSRPELNEPGFWGSNRPEQVHDAAHPDFVTYHAGTPAEQSFSLALPG